MSVSYWDQVDFEVEITRPITLTLDDNELIFAQRNHWHLVKSDVQRAVEEIERLRQELDKSTKVNQELLQDIVEINQTKEVMLEILAEERKKNFQLEQEILGYKNELKECFKTILSLKPNDDNR